MSATYTTIQGETWDNIALKVYGGERHADFLMANNYPYLDVLVFSAGTVLATPDMPEKVSKELPSWRTSHRSGQPDPYE